MPTQPSAAPEQAHTAEPWDWSYAGSRMSEYYSQPFAIASGAVQLVAGCFGDVRGGKEQAKANAERIVACVNACAGLNPAALPDAIYCLGQIIAALPIRRDWLDPEIEARAKEALANLKPT